MVITWNVTVPELTGDAPRKAYLYLPESYDREPDKRYPRTIPQILESTLPPGEKTRPKGKTGIQTAVFFVFSSVLCPFGLL